MAADGSGAGERPGREATASAASKLTLSVAPDQAGRRLDRWLADAVPGLSRARLQALIDGGRVQVDGRARKLDITLTSSDRDPVIEPPVDQELPDA